MRSLILSTLVLLVACASTSSTGIVPIGGDTYMVSKSSDTNMATGSEVKADLFKEANGYCGKQGKKIKTVREASRDSVPFVRPASAELRFQCE